MNKKGQMFLVAALIIVTLAIGLTTIYTSVQAPKEDTSVYDLSDEISFEGASVLDHGVFSPESDLEGNINSLRKDYSALNPDSDVIIVYGDKETITQVTYYESSVDSGSVTFGAGGSDITVQTFQKRELLSVTPVIDENTNTVTISLPDLPPQKFILSEGQNFYIIISKQNGEEKYVVAK
jgi:hypothetical protein